MKAICKICNNVKDFDSKDVKKIYDALIICNPNIKSEDYITLLNIMSDKDCIDNEEHLYMFHDDFERIINEMIKTHEILLDKKNKLSKMEKELEFRKINLENELDSVNEKLCVIPGSIRNCYNKIKMLNREFEYLTGTIYYTIFMEEDEEENNE